MCFFPKNKTAVTLALREYHRERLESSFPLINNYNFIMERLYYKI